MEQSFREFVEIENTTGTYKVYSDEIPDVIINSTPVELQEVSFSADGKGQRDAYNYHSVEKIKFSSNRLMPSIKAKLHKHDYFEMAVIVSGEFEMQIESQLCRFKKWDVCLLNRSTRHAEHFKPDSRLFYITLSTEFLTGWSNLSRFALQPINVFDKFFNKGLRDNIQQNKDFIIAEYRNDAAVSPVFDIIGLIRREFEHKQPGYYFFIYGFIYRLMNILADSQYYQTEYTDLGADDGFSLAFSAKQILDKHKRKMTKMEVGERLNYNAEYINKVFKKHYGCTIPSYNQSVYLQQAVFLLCNTDLHIHRICKMIGFSNRTHFYKIFSKAYGCTPAAYRKKWSNHSKDLL